MDSDTAYGLYRQIEATKLARFKNELLTMAVRYARLRTDWQLADLQSRREIDRHRTAVHDALIDACNILSRNMTESGEDSSWRASLNDRKEIGDFACYVHCFLGLAAR
jgi:hypothetical protein